LPMGVLAVDTITASLIGAISLVILIWFVPSFTLP